MQKTNLVFLLLFCILHHDCFGILPDKNVLPFSSSHVSIHGMQSENHNIHPNFLALFQATHSIPSSGSSYSFVDTRLKLDLQKDSNYHELNLGLARRQAFNHQHNHYYGVYGFWDISHTKNQVYLTQTTLGTEVISPHWYWNINGYVPLGTYTTAYSFLDNINTSTTVFNKNLFLSISKSTSTLLRLKL